MIIILFLVIQVLFTWNLFLLDKVNKLERQNYYLLKDNNRYRKEKEKNV